MRKFLVPSLVIALALLIAVPSFALEVKWGGLFRARVLSQEAFTSYSYPANDLSMIRTNPLAERSINYAQHVNRFDQRLRMFIDFISSENLKVVTKLEANTIWGAYGSPTARNIVGGGNVGADNNNLGIKNVYLDFKIPNTPLSAKVGVQGINLIDSWVIDSDFSAAVLVADLKPFSVILGYASGQNFDTTSESENIDDSVAVVSYKEGPFSAALVGLWQDAHNVPASIFPQVGAYFDDPLQINVPASPTPFVFPYGKFNAVAENNQLFDLGFQLGYKIDYLSAYVNFVKNFGSVDLGAQRGTTNIYDFDDAKYRGWMVDAGVNWFCGPWTLNGGGFYTSGQKVDVETIGPNGQVIVPNSSDIDQFVYPLSTSKYFSELMGGGILDNTAPNGGYWRGYPAPTNIWTLTAGAAWQALPQTKLALSYWYFGTSTKVPSRYDATFGTWNTSSNLGHEIDLNITQNIVDKLNLDLVGAYMFTGDAFRAKTEGYDYQKDDNCYELGARLQWAW